MEVNKRNDEEVTKLLDTLRERDLKLSFVENEVKKLTITRQEIIKLIQNKDIDLANDLIEKMPELERIAKEKNDLDNKLNEDNQEKKRQSLYMKVETDKVKLEPAGFNLSINAAFLNLGKHLNGIIDETMFTSYQKQILAYYSNEIPTEAQGIETNREDLSTIHWQYVLVFKNPDFAAKEQKLDLDSANRLYDRCFMPDKQMKTNLSKFQENLVYKYILDKEIKKETNNDDIKYNLNKGGNFIYKNGTWTGENSHPKDILTLTRNIALYKITNVLHLQTASLLSENGEKIYVLIHADEELLRDFADLSEYDLQFEIGSTDLLSLEPCDKKLRPLRFIKDGKPNEIRLKEEELKLFSEFIYSSDELEVYNGQTIQEQTKVSDQEWESYKSFLGYISENKSESLNLIKNFPELKGLLIRELYEKAFISINGSIGSLHQLRNLWNYFKTDEIGAYKHFFREYDKILNVDKADAFWRRQISNEGEISLFKDLDKIKLIISYLYSQLRMDNMQTLGILENYFPLHSKNYNKSEEFLIYVKSHEQLIELKEVKYENDAKSLNKVETNNKSNLSLKINLASKILEKQVTYNEVKEKWKYSLLGKVPTNCIRDYFGEKVALYYAFLSFYTLYLFALGILGIIVYIIQSQDSLQSNSIEFFSAMGFTKSRVVISFNTLYSFVVIIWSTVFLEHWKRTQYKLAVEWGQLKNDETEDVLPSFIGNKRRSPVNDTLNEAYYSYFIHTFKKILAYLISLIIVVIVIVLVLYLLYFRNWLAINKIGGPYNKFIINVPSKIFS